ncbi:MAG: hypothetical protein EPN92_07295 [Chitinophagaceae bacterium]|nr:MAG: hypothetical protein EPN92_07295 [Chitinophagaceae bacterium]
MGWFLFPGLFISLAICTELAYLFLAFEIQKRLDNLWNYVYEGRYFAFTNVYLQLAFTGWVFLYPTWKKSFWQKIIVLAFSALLFIEITHNIYFNTKVALSFNHYKSTNYKQQDYAYFNRLIDSVMKENPGVEILAAADSDHFHPYMATYLNQKGIFDGINLNKGLPQVKKKTILLMMLYEKELTDYQYFFPTKT